MPFIAIRKATRERIDITAGECLCQLCGAPMIVKAGLVRQHHFAHAGRCTSDYQSHPESPAHREAKRYLDTHLREWFKEYANTHIAYEVPIPEVKRIADLLVTFPTGWRVAHEVQLASITTEHLQERTSQEPLPCNGKGLRNASSCPVGFSNEKQQRTRLQVRLSTTLVQTTTRRAQADVLRNYAVLALTKGNYTLAWTRREEIL